MQQKIIRLCYRKIIDSSSAKAWDRYVFDSSYAEFLLQVQFYNQQGQYKRFDELIKQFPAAEKLHFLVSASVTGYLQQLNNTIPDILNNLGKSFLSFSHYNFEIINSDIKNKNDHRVAISFFSELLTWHNTIADHLLVSELNQPAASDGQVTHMVRIQPYLSIHSLKTEQI